MSHSPYIARVLLGRKLKQYRIRADDMPVAEASRRTGISESKLRKLENATNDAIRLPDIYACSSVYELTSRETKHLIGLAEGADSHGWYHDYDVAPEFAHFIEQEGAASAIHILELELIAGLLQTEEYLLAFQDAALPQPPEVAEAVRSLRTLRQKLIRGRTTPPRMEFLIGEGAMRYLDRLPASVKDNQIRRLLEAAAEPSVDIRVITEMHAGAAGAFNIITAAEEETPFVFIDDLDGCRYVEDRDIVSMYVQTFMAAREMTIGVKEYLR